MDSNPVSYTTDSSGRVRRIFVSAIASLFLLGTFSGFIGVVRASDGFFDPPHSDFAEDTDMPPNGLYNFLLINASVNVTVPGMLFVIADLYDNSGLIQIDSQFGMANLPVGNRTIQISFMGSVIRSAGYDGPYQVDLYLFDDMFTFLGQDAHTTSAYLALDFEGTAAMFSPPHQDYGIDNDGDTLYDFLIVNTTVTVNTSGFYDVDGELWDVTNMTLVEMVFNYTYLTSGTHNVDLAFTGFEINNSGIDGPYWVELYLYDDMFNQLDYGGHLTNAYFFTDFDGPPAMFFPPHGDKGWDTDGNLLFEYLYVSVNVDVDLGGTYTIQGFGPEVGWSQNTTYLTAGLHAVDLLFYGFLIHTSATDGPYMIQLNLMDDSFNVIDSDMYITNPYLYTEFEPNPPIAYVPPYADDGVDSDGDAKFNYLRIQTRYTANVSGDYDFYAVLWDITQTTWISNTNNASYRPSGAGQVDILFNGWDIYNSGIDGPYWVDLYIADEWGYVLDNDTHITGAYLYTDFDPIPARFSPPHSDHGLDTSVPADGIYEKLVVDASVLVNDPGWYYVSAALYDPMIFPITTETSWVNLSAGYTNVSIEFPGIDVYNCGLDGTFLVIMDLYKVDIVGPPIWLDNDGHWTNIYNYTDFGSSPSSLLYGYVYQVNTGMPLSNSDVIAVNYTFGWFRYTTTDAMGYYEIDAFDGDFLVLFDHGLHQANISWITISGDTYAQKVLEYIPPNSLDSSATWPDWDNLTMGLMGGLREDNMTFRVIVDAMYGNIDGYLDQSENDFFITFVLGFISVPIPTNTSGMVHVDSIWYDLNPGTVNMVLDLTGKVDTLRPFTVMFEANYTSNTTIPPFPGHLVQMYVDYDTSSEEHFVTGLAPLAWNLQSFDPVTDVDITGIGSPSFTVDPLAGTGSVWVNLTFGQASPDTEPPEISNVTINGLAVATYGMLDLPPVIYINATLNDVPTGNRPIGGANFTEGPLNFPGTAMLAMDGTFDSPTEDVTGTIVSPPLGQTFYCVYGWDATPNNNMTGACAELNIFDDFGPEITAVRIDGLAVQNYQLSTAPATATLTAFVDDSARGNADIAGANYTTPTVSAWPGIAMSAFDGAFDSPTEDVTVSIPVPTSAGTYNYFIHAWDVVPNYSPSAPSAQINIIDDVAPAVLNVLLNGQPTATVMPGAAVSLDVVIDDTSGHGDTAIAGANFTVGPANWPGQWMLPTDGAFDTALEGATETIDTIGWPDGVYQICVYGWDSVPNHNTTDVCAALTISSVDALDPEIGNVLVNGSASVMVAPGTILNLTATVDDSATGGSDIVGANYTIDGDWLSSSPMSALDGAFDSQTEDVYASIDTTSWADGPYQVCVHGWDAAPNYNISMTACAQITIQTPDNTPPNIINVLLDGSATLTVAPGTTVALSATIDDSTTGNGIIGGANYTVDMTWPGIAMNPVDGTFDTETEDVVVSIDTTGWPDGIYQICVHGWDDVPNYHYAFDACAQLTVQSVPPDTTPPTISNLQQDPDPAGPGDDVMITATVTDDDQVSGVWIEVFDPSSNSIGNNTMTYDSVNDEYYSEDSYTDLGTYTYTIWATDPAGNWASASGDFDVVEQDPPTIDVTVSDSNPDVGDTVTFEADVEDDSEIDDVRITILTDLGDVVVNNRRMTEDGGVYTYEYDFDVAGDYTYTITATDEHGNSGDVTGAISVKEPAAPSFFEEYWWLILVIVIIIVVLLVVGLLMRKPKVEEVPPAEMMPEEPPVVEPYEEMPMEPEPPTDETLQEPPPPEEYVEELPPPED